MNLFFTSLLLACAVCNVAAIKCYTCDSIKDPTCKDPFVKQNQNWTECPYNCKKSQGKVIGISYDASRECTTAKDERDHTFCLYNIDFGFLFTGDSCWCDEDFCNGSSDLSAGALRCVILSLLAVVLVLSDIF